MRKLIVIAVSLWLLTSLTGCRWQLHPSADARHGVSIAIDRFDRMERLYLTTGDVAALHQMKTEFPIQTRTLIEDVLRLGAVNDSDINIRWLRYYQDSTLQCLLDDVGKQYEQIDDIDRQLSASFRRLAELLPGISIPHVYAQVGSLDQSIVIADSTLGISLDKYLGLDYPLYLRFGFSRQQRQMMTRDCIVPDCLSFYLLSLYPLPDADSLDHAARRFHMSKIQCLVNKAMGHQFFRGDTLTCLQHYRFSHPRLSADEFLHLPSMPQ